MEAAAELGRKPVSKHQIQPEYGDERAQAGRDCRTRLARPLYSQRERGQGNIRFPCSADHKQDWQPYSVDPYSCYMCDHTYIIFSRSDTNKEQGAPSSCTVLYSTVGVGCAPPSHLNKKQTKKQAKKKDTTTKS